MLRQGSNLAVLAVFLLAVQANSPEPTRPSQFKQDIESCRALNPVTDETLENLNRKGALLDENDQDARCFVVCMMQKGGLVSDEGTFNASNAKQYILKRVPVLVEGGATGRPGQPEVDLAVDQCAICTGEGKCMVNYKIWTCLYNKLHERS